MTLWRLLISNVLLEFPCLEPQWRSEFFIRGFISPWATLYTFLATGRGGTPRLTDVGWLICEGFTCVNGTLRSPVPFRVNLSVGGGTRAEAEHEWRDRQRQAQGSLSGGDGHSSTRRSTKHECVTTEPRWWRRKRRQPRQGETVTSRKSGNFH